MVPVRPALLVLLMCPIVMAAHAPTWAQVSFPIVDGQPAATRLDRVLASRTSLTINNITMAAFAEQLRQQFAIDVVVDVKALDDVGMGPDAVLSSVTLRDASLEEALNLVLGAQKLSFLVRGEALVLTTPEEADSCLETFVYPVADLVQVVPTPRWRDAGYGDDYDTLIQVIQSTLSPDSWEDVGGAGEIEAFPISRSLVISATRDVHRQVVGLLGALRSSQRVAFPGLKRASERVRPDTGSRPFRGVARDQHSLVSNVSGPSWKTVKGGWQIPPRFD